jgi:energy-converting hydrogenase Eha subunit C
MSNVITRQHLLGHYTFEQNCELAIEQCCVVWAGPRWLDWSFVLVYHLTVKVWQSMSFATWTLLCICSIIGLIVKLGSYLVLPFFYAGWCLMQMIAILLLPKPLAIAVVLFAKPLAMILIFLLSLLPALFLWLLKSALYLAVAFIGLQLIIYCSENASRLAVTRKEHRQRQQRGPKAWDKSTGGSGMQQRNTKAWDEPTNDGGRLSGQLSKGLQSLKARDTAQQLANDRTQYQQWQKHCDTIFAAGHGQLKFPPSWPCQVTDCLPADRSLLEAQCRVLKRLLSSTDSLMAACDAEAVRWHPGRPIFSTLEKTDDGRGSVAMAEELTRAISMMYVLERSPECRPQWPQRWRRHVSWDTQSCTTS